MCNPYKNKEEVKETLKQLGVKTDEYKISISRTDGTVTVIKKRRFTLEDVHEFLSKMNLGKWNGKRMKYDVNTSKPVQATIEDFRQHPYHELGISDLKRGYASYVLFNITDNMFTMQLHRHSEPEDYSPAWQMFLELQEYKRKEAESSAGL